MVDVAMWQDKAARAAFEAKARERLESLQAELTGKSGIVAVDPESGNYYLGATLGQANAAAFAEHPDQWLYFVRVEDPEAAIALPTW